MTDSIERLYVSCPKCSLTDMPMRSELVGYVVRCLCHACYLVVEMRDGRPVARMATEAEVQAAGWRQVR